MFIINHLAKFWYRELTLFYPRARKSCIEILQFWGHFQSNIPYFWLRMVEEELRMEKSYLRYKEGEWRIENFKLRMDGCGLRINNSDLRVPSFPSFQHLVHIFLLIHYPLSWITLFWRHNKDLNFCLRTSTTFARSVPYHNKNKKKNHTKSTRNTHKI